MAAKRETIISPADIFQPDQSLDKLAIYDDPPDESERELSEVLGELGGADDAKISIYKQGAGKDTRGGEFVDTVHPSEFSLSWLRDAYGPGQYRLHIRSNGRLIANRTARIAPSLKKPDDVAGSGLRELAETMQQGFMQLGQMLVKVVETSRAPAIDANQAQASALQNMLLMKQILAPASVVPPTDPMQMFLKGIEIASNMSKGETPISEREPGSTDILMKAIETFGGPIAEMVAAGKSAPQSQPQSAMQALPPGASPMQQNPQPRPPMENDPMFGLKQYASMLENIAREDRDPYTYASLVVDSAPRADVENVISQADPIIWLSQYNPNLADPALRPWLDEFIAMLREILTGPPAHASVESTQSNFSAQNATIGGQSITFPIGQQSDSDNGDA